MAERIQRPNLLPYRSALEGAIPLQAMSRAYDRLDRITAATETATTKSLALLNEQKANLAPGDERGRAFLDEQYGKLRAMSKQAAEENNVPGYARSIRKQIQALAIDPRFAQIQQNVKDLEKYEQRRSQLIANGKTTIGVGPRPEEFQSLDENDNPVQFNSYVAEEPDYKKAHQAVFRNVGTDVLDSKQALSEYVYGPGGDPDKLTPDTSDDNYRAFFAYRNTPEGRIEMDQMARALHKKPFLDLPPEEKAAIARTISDRIYNDAIPLINTPRTGRGSSRAATDPNAPKGVVLGGNAAAMIPDGDESTPDQVFLEFSDRTDNSMLDEYLMMTISGQQDQVKLDQEGNLVQLPNYLDGTRKVNKVVMGAAGYNATVENPETGKKTVRTVPMIRVHTTQGSGVNAKNEVIMRPMNEEDLLKLQDNMGPTLLQINSPNTGYHTRQGVLPLLSHVYASELGDVLYGDATSVDLPRAGLKVVKEGDLFRFKDIATGELIVYNGEPLAVSKDNKGAVETAVGSFILEREIGGR